MKELKIIVPENCSEFGELLCEHLKTIRGIDEDYIINLIADFDSDRYQLIINNI